MNPQIEQIKTNFCNMLTTSNQKYNNTTLKAAWLDTPLGPIIAIADEQALYLLEFFDRRNVKREIEKLQTHTKSTIIFGTTPALESIKKEITQYFEGTLQTFTTPLHLSGSPFQQCVWQTLITIPYGQTCSYKKEALSINKPSASRAVANANGANQLAIIIPCHRVINSSGKLGGYGAGIVRKQWLLDHEKRNIL